MLPLVIRVDDSGSRTSTVHAFADSPVRVGRNPLNDLVLDNDAVSQFHAEIEFDEADTRVLDLGSTNGSAIAGTVLQPQVPQSVPPRTVITLGPLSLMLDRTQPPAMLAAPAPRSFAGRLDAPADAPAVGTRVFSRSRIANAPPAAIAPAASGAHGQATVMHVPETASGRYAATVMAAPDAARATAPPDPIPVAVTPHARDAVSAVRPAYEAYRRAWDALEAAIARALESAPPAEAAAMLAAMDQGFEALAQEPRFRALALARGVWLMSPAATPAHAFDRVAQVADHLGVARPTRPPEIDEFLVRMVRMLETFADAMLALRSNQEALRRDAKRPPSPQAAPLGGATQPGAVLSYLLDPTVATEARTDELRRTFADVVANQSALLQGVVRGVRSYLARLAPEAIDSELSRTGGAGFLGFLRAFRESALWRRYIARFRAATSNDDEIRAAVLMRR